MRKYAYLARLEELLAALPAQERQEALNYYEEYFDAAGNENEEKTAEELGDPAEVARKILEGEGIEADSPTEQQEAASPRQAGTTPYTGDKIPKTAPAGPEPPELENPEEYPASGVSAGPAVSRRVRRGLWIVFWLLVALALVIQVSALLFGLRGLSHRGGETASMAVSQPLEEAETSAVTPMPTAATELAAEGTVTYSGTLETPGKGTFFVNLARGNVVFRTGEAASVEVRNVDVTNNVSYGQTVDYGYAFVCDSTDPNTHVTITLPADAYERLEVHISDGGAIELGDLQIREIDAFTASGPIQSGRLQTENLNVQTAAGNIWLEEIADSDTYQAREISILAPHGYVAAGFSAPRNEWETDITAPEGVAESSGTLTSEQADRSLAVTAATTVNLKYGV